MASEASPLTIRELGGQQREVTLLGRGLPYRGFQLTTKQRAPIVWNPGSPEGTGTVLGATEDPTSINGMWKDKFIDVTGASAADDVADGQDSLRAVSLPQGQPPITSNNSPVSTVRDAVALFDSICREGQLLEVTWFTEKRHGYLVRFMKNWQNTHDAEWSMQFDWIGRGEPVGHVSFVTGTQPSNSFNAMNSAMQSLDDLQEPRLGFNQPFLDGITGVVNNIQNGIFGLQDTVANLTDQVLSPVRAVRGMIATILGIEEETKVMLDFLSAQTAEAIAPIPDSGVDSMSQAERLSLQLYREELKAWARHMQRTATTQRYALTSQIEGDLEGIHVARAGEDLRDVSQKFYNTPYEWRRIMLFNQLDSVELRAGQVVLVPKINPEEAGTGGSR